MVSPDTGTTDPMAYRLYEGIAYSGPIGMVLHEKIIGVHVDLNQWIRFERPGHYRIKELRNTSTLPFSPMDDRFSLPESKHAMAPKFGHMFRMSTRAKCVL